MSIVCLALAGLTSAGCVSNISRRRPYADYRGKTLALTEDARLVRTPGWDGGNVSMALSGPRRINELFAESDPVLREEMFGLWKHERLPAGTPVRLTKFVYRRTDTGRYIEAMGRVRVPDQPREVPFVYVWAEECDPVLRRAPWEPADTPVDQRPLRRPRNCPDRSAAAP